MLTHLNSNSKRSPTIVLAMIFLKENKVKKEQSLIRAFLIFFLGLSSINLAFADYADFTQSEEKGSARFCESNRYNGSKEDFLSAIEGARFKGFLKREISNSGDHVWMITDDSEEADSALLEQADGKLSKVTFFEDLENSENDGVKMEITFMSTMGDDAYIILPRMRVNSQGDYNLLNPEGSISDSFDLDSDLISDDEVECRQE
jgi:hypothetical protein